MKNNVSVCFILDHKLMDYRLPFFKQLQARGYDITVVHPGDITPGGHSFREIKSYKKKSFFFERRILPDPSLFTIIVHMQNLRLWDLWSLTLKPYKRYKIIHWGIGVSSAKGLRLHKTMASIFRDCLVRFASAQVLYSRFPLALFSKSNVKKTFVADNTIYNPNATDYSVHQKDSFLFIGSLNSRKGLDKLVKVFSQYHKAPVEKKIHKLVIIGDGSIRTELESLARTHNISEKVIFTGELKDASVKEQYFRNAIVSISPKQAGLSVLESFSYGVPFICDEKAISGGEHLNIENGKNGYLVTGEIDLLKHMLNLNSDVELGKYLGHNAFVHYYKNRTMQNMVDSFEEAFNFVLNKKIC